MLFVLMQTDLQFAAPDKPGLYRYSVVLRSDSYLDLSFSQDIKVIKMNSCSSRMFMVSSALKLNVGAHQEVSGRAQWAELEKEEEEEELIEESVSEAELTSSDNEEY